MHLSLETRILRANYCTFQTGIRVKMMINCLVLGCPKGHNMSQRAPLAVTQLCDAVTVTGLKQCHNDPKCDGWIKYESCHQRSWASTVESKTSNHWWLHQWKRLKLLEHKKKSSTSSGASVGNWGFPIKFRFLLVSSQNQSEASRGSSSLCFWGTTSLKSPWFDGNTLPKWPKYTWV